MFPKALVAVVFAFGCIPADQGGGGGLGAFTRGFAFVRSGNIFLADQSNYTATPIQLTTNGGNRHPSLSADGRRVVFVHATNEIDIVSASTGASASIVYSAATGQSNLRTPVFSPDGQIIVFAYDFGAVSVLGRVNADGSRFQELTLAPISVAAPSFYSNGENVLVIQGTSRSRYDQLARVNLTTGTATNVVGSLGTSACVIANRAVLSPDNIKVAFDARTGAGTSCGGSARIFVMDLSTRGVTQLTDYPSVQTTIDGFPTWVGIDQVGYSSNFGGADQVYTLPTSIEKSSGTLRVPTASEPYFGPN
jgi:Tol biopolymer transport system component